MTSDSDLEGLRKRLRRDLQTRVEVTLPAAELRLLLDELGRLLQSNDRLRRQNRRVRKKLQRAGLPDDPADRDEAAESGDVPPN